MIFDVPHFASQFQQRRTFLDDGLHVVAEPSFLTHRVCQHAGNDRLLDALHVPRRQVN